MAARLVEQRRRNCVKEMWKTAHLTAFIKK
jgi:hypothetical protein